MYSLLLRSFDLRSVTRFDHAKNFNVPHGTGRVDFRHPALQQNSRTKQQAPCRYKGGIGDVRYSVLCPAHVSSSLCVLLPTPSSGLCTRAGHYFGYSSTMSWSDCHAAIPPPCLFSACCRLPFQERHGSPKFRCKPLDDLPWTQTPARRGMLTLTHVTLLASRP